MKGSTLSVHVIDARNLKSSNDFANSQVRLSIEEQSSNTQRVNNSNDPVWNEVIAFDISKGTEPLVIEVMDFISTRQKEIIGRYEIDLSELYIQEEQMIRD